MHELIRKWQQAEKELQGQRLRADQLLQEAEANTPAPAYMASAAPNDIYEGAVIWYRHDDPADGNFFWVMVDEVERPSDPFKAFTAHDGCRYGLDGALVEISLKEDKDD